MEPDVRLMAYLDGELGPAEREAFEQEVARDPGLRGEIERQRELRRRLAAAYDPILQEPVPPGLIATASVANDPGRPSWRPAHWAAVAASLVVGLLVGQAALRPQAPFVEQGGELVARGEIARALTRQLASDVGPTQVGLTFRTAEGSYCRTFQDRPRRLAGLACRRQDRWTARTLTAWAPNAEGDYRTAGSQTPAAVLASVDELISGQPLDAAAEAKARAEDWRR